MKVKVVNEFRDKYTSELYTVGTELEITEERYDEIVKVGRLVEIMKEEFVEEESVEEAPAESARETEQSEQSEQSEPIEKPKAVRRKRSK